MNIYAYDVQFHAHGQIGPRINRPNIKPSSKVFASITEVGTGFIPFLGAARMTIHNVVPYDGYVEVLANIEWPTDLHFTINLLVVNI